MYCEVKCVAPLRLSSYSLKKKILLSFKAKLAGFLGGIYSEI
jgi:hypothetical protein